MCAIFFSKLEHADSSNDGARPNYSPRLILCSSADLRLHEFPLNSAYYRHDSTYGETFTGLRTASQLTEKGSSTWESGGGRITVTPQPIRERGRQNPIVEAIFIQLRNSFESVRRLVFRCVLCRVPSLALYLLSFLRSLDLSFDPARLIGSFLLRHCCRSQSVRTSFFRGACKFERAASGQTGSRVVVNQRPTRRQCAQCRTKLWSAESE